MRPILVTAPAALPIEANDVIARAPSLASADPDVVTALIEAAVSHLDGWSGILGRCLVAQTWKVEPCAHDWDRYRLPFPQVLAISSVKVDGSVLAEADYALRQDATGWYVAPLVTWPTGDVAIEFTAGYGSPDDVPAAIKQAIVMMVAGMYATTEANGGLRSFEVHGTFTRQFNSPEMVDGVRTKAVDMLLAPFRRMSV